jgi:hypothetical protein
MTIPAPADKQAGLSWRTKAALGCTLSPLVIVALLAIGGGIGYWVFQNRSRKDLQREMDLVRSTGAPLNTIELDQEYVPIAGKENVTNELLQKFSFASDPEFNKSTRELPILGISTKQPPLPGSDWPERDEVEAFLSQHRDALDYCSTLPERDVTARFPADVRFAMSTKLAHLDLLRRVFKILSLQMHCDLHAGRPEEASDRILQQLALAATLEHEPMIVSQLVRIAMIGVALKNLELLLLHSQLGDEELLRLQTTIRQIDMQAALQRALIGERAMYFTEMSVPLQYFCEEAPLEVIENSTEHLPPRAADAAWLLANFRRLLDANKISLYQARREAEQLNVELKKFGQSPKRLLYVQTLLFLPAIPSGGVEGVSRCDANCKAMDVLLAAKRYRHVHHRWPTTTQQLVPDFLPAVPIDVYVDRPIILLADNEALKAYSVGKNLTDDGGKWDDRDFSDLGFAIEAK